MTENDDDFEKRLRAVFARADKAAVPPLTPEWLATLRELLPASRPSRPSLALLWKRLKNDTRDALIMVNMTGLTGGGDSMPLFRDCAAPHALPGMRAYPDERDSAAGRRRVALGGSAAIATNASPH